MNEIIGMRGIGNTENHAHTSLTWNITLVHAVKGAQNGIT